MGTVAIGQLCVAWVGGTLWNSEWSGQITHSIHLLDSFGMNWKEMKRSRTCQINQLADCQLLLSVVGLLAKVVPCLAG